MHFSHANNRTLLQAAAKTAKCYVFYWITLFAILYSFSGNWGIYYLISHVFKCSQSVLATFENKSRRNSCTHWVCLIFLRTYSTPRLWNATLKFALCKNLSFGGKKSQVILFFLEDKLTGGSYSFRTPSQNGWYFDNFLCQQYCRSVISMAWTPQLLNETRLAGRIKQQHS